MRKPGRYWLTGCGILTKTRPMARLVRRWCREDAREVRCREQFFQGGGTELGFDVVSGECSPAKRAQSEDINLLRQIRNVFGGIVAQREAVGIERNVKSQRFGFVAHFHWDLDRAVELVG